MSSFDYFKDFLKKQLTDSAGEEIFGVFKQTLNDYEDEIHRQRRLLDYIHKPEREPNSTDLQQQHVCKEEEMAPDDQQLCKQEWTSSGDQEELHPLQITEKLEEPCSSQQGLTLKLETDAFEFTPTRKERDHIKRESEHDDLLVSSISHAADQKQEATGSTEESVSRPTTRHQRQSDRYNVHNADTSETDSDTCTDETSGHSTLTDKQTHLESQTEWPYACKNCGKRFIEKSKFKFHMCIHTDEKSYSCKQCGKSFRYQCQYEIHMRIHSGAKPYVCKTCGKGFARSSTLNIHERIHTGDKPYSCNTCTETFARRSQLNIHIRTHTGESPHCCNTCGKNFRFAGELKIHMRWHTGEKPFRCKVCTLRFKTMSELKRHLKVHTDERPHSCETCGKSFQFGSDLKIHRRIHTNEKPFLCETCGKSFTSSSTLASHKTRNHAAEKSKDLEKDTSLEEAQMHSSK